MTWVGLIGRGCLLIKRSIWYKFHNMCPLRRQNWGLQYIWPFCDWGTNCRQPFSMVQSSSGIQIPIALGGSVYRKVESRCGLTTGAKVNKTSYSVKIWLGFHTVLEWCNGKHKVFVGSCSFILINLKLQHSAPPPQQPHWHLYIQFVQTLSHH